MNYSMIHSDYRDVDLKTSSVDLIICDPPYGETENEWDYNSEESINHLFNFFDRVKKKEAPVVVFGQKEFAAKLKLRDNFKYDLIWEKSRPSGFLNANKMPLRCHEEIMVFYDQLPVYNPQMEKGEKNHSIGSPEEHTNNNYGDFELIEPNGSGMKYPRSVLKFKKPHPPIHPTQKPVELYEWLIKTYTNPNGIVLDPMCGVGTTACAALKTGRKYICIEKDREYYEKGLNKVKEMKRNVELRQEKQEMFGKFFE